MAQCATTALAGAVPRSCVRGARGQFGGLGPVPGVVSPLFPRSRPACPALCVAGRPVRVSLTLAGGTRFHAVCAFSGLGLVALLVFPACPWCVCALALLRRPRPPPPPLVGVARAPRAVPVLGAGRAVPRSPCPSACPASVPCSVWLAWGGGRPGPVFPPTWLGAVRSPWGGSAHPGRSCAGGRGWVGWGGGGPCAAPLCLCCRGGQWGGGSLCLVPCLCPPWAGNKAGVTGGVLVMEGVAPIPLRFLVACLLLARSVLRPGVLARVRLLPAVPVGAGGWGGEAGRAPFPLTGAAVPPGGEGIIPSSSGGVGAGAPAACGPAGGVGVGGGSRCGAPAPPLGGGLRFPALPPLSSLAHSPPACAFCGGRRAVPCTGCGLLGGGGGGLRRGGPWTPPPGAPSDPKPPSALPEWATLWVSLAMLWSWGARPPYCSGAPPRAAPGRGLRAAPARWCGLAHRPRPPREQATGGAGARGVQVQLRPPPRFAVPSGGGGGVPSAPGGWGFGAPAALKPGGEQGGGRGGRSAAPHPPAPSGVGLPSFVSGAPPRGILVLWGLPGGHGRWARPGRLPMGQCGGGGGVRGGVISSPWFTPPPSPGRPLKGAAPFAPSWVPPVRRRSVSGRAGACGRFTGGACSSRGAPPPPPPGAAASPGGAGQLSLQSASVCS